ncbi:MAG: cytochrome-c peroxidase [Verrucomicrobiaceae bacterium]
MKAHLLPLIVLITLPAMGQNGVLNLTELSNYANQGQPGYIRKDNTPADNPITDIGATLGRVMFYDVRLSKDATISCASCHQQEHAFGDTATASVGVAGTTGRHSMRLINARFGDEENFFWDERAVSLEDQTTRPIQDHVEMGFSGEDGDPGFGDLVERLEVIEEYRVLFSAVFGDPQITEGRVQKVLSQFVRSIQSFDSKYDVGRAQVRNDNAAFANFSDSENRGKILFQTAPQQGGAGCGACHRAPEFDIDPNSRNNGVIGSLGGGTDLTNTRAPSLRDLVDPEGNLNGGLMHNGVFETIRGAIEHYNAVPNVQGLDPRLGGGPGGGQRLNLSEQEKLDLEAFLRTLTGSAVYTDERWSSPFGEEGELGLIILPEEGTRFAISKDAFGDNWVTVSRQGVPNLTYLYKSSADLDGWSEAREIVADEEGLISLTLPASAGSRYFHFAYAVSVE